MKNVMLFLALIWTGMGAWAQNVESVKDSVSANYRLVPMEFVSTLGGAHMDFFMERRRLKDRAQLPVIKDHEAIVIEDNETLLDFLTFDDGEFWPAGLTALPEIDFENRTLVGFFTASGCRKVLKIYLDTSECKYLYSALIYNCGNFSYVPMLNWALIPKVCKNYKFQMRVIYEDTEQIKYWKSLGKY
jgi:hypothetical protein